MVVCQTERARRRECMIKPIFRQSKWLASLIILVIATTPIASCTAANQTPNISNLTADYEGEVYPTDSFQIECDASDPDEDDLAYAWTVSGGTISGVGSTVTWTAPEGPGTYTIAVQVSDGREGIDTEELTIEVVDPNQHPIIESLTTDCPRLRQTVVATIVCMASDPDGDVLDYEWSVDRGEIEGTGHTVTWLSPDEYGKFEITVIVTDGRGGHAYEVIELNVCSCGDACQ